MSEVRFSIVTVCMDCESVIQGCIDSVRSQSMPHIEHVIVDGKSSDSTVEIVSSEQSRFGSRITHVLSEADSGIYNAMNKGLALCSGNWVYFLNADDRFFDSRVLERVAKELDGGNVDILLGKVLLFDKASGVASIHAPRIISKQRLLSGGVYQQNWFASSKAFEIVGNFDEQMKLCGDVEWLGKAVQKKLSFRATQILFATFAKGGKSSNFDLVKTEHREMERRITTPLEWLLLKLRKRLVQAIYRFLHWRFPGVLD